MARKTPVDPTVLKRNRLFSVLEQAELDSVMAFARQVRLDTEMRLFSKGDPGDSMFAVLRGRLQVQTESLDAKVMLLNMLKEGDVFGEIALLDGRERSATVVAAEPTELLRIDRSDFMPFLRSRPDLCIRMMGVLCERVRWTSEIIEDTVFLNVPQRLAKRILMLAQTYGRKSDDGTRIAHFISQEALANMLGVSREIVNKTLKGFIALGAISYRNGYIILHRADVLDRIAGQSETNP